MKFTTSVCLHSHLLLALCTIISAQICYDTGNFTTTSPYAENRREVLSSLATNVILNGGFFSNAIGQDSDKVYGQALCVTTASPEDCSRCVTLAVEGLAKTCPNQKEAISLGGDPIPCIVRYANRPIYGKMELNPALILTNIGDITSNMTEFDQVWGDLIGTLITRASMGYTLITRASMGYSSITRKLYAAGVAHLVRPNQSIYALMECTPDISESECRYCLEQSAIAYQNCCHGKRGGPVSRPSCYFRWDMYPFYNAFNNVSTLSSPPPLLPPPTE